MALRANRYEATVDHSYFMCEPAERGSLVFKKPITPSCPYLEASKNLGPKANRDFIGILLNDVVDIDLTRTHLQWHNGQIPRGGKVQILTKGWVIMKVSFRDRFPIGHPVYIHPKTGKPTLVQWGMPIGRLLSRRDKDGYVKIELN